jgi:hypothetical protein
LALAVTIITFLAGISFLEDIGGGDNSSGVYQVAGLFAASAVSLVAFISIEKRVHSPLLDFKIMTSKSFLLPTIILMLLHVHLHGLARFLVMVASSEAMHAVAASAAYDRAIYRTISGLSQIEAKNVT